MIIVETARGRLARLGDAGRFRGLFLGQDASAWQCLTSGGTEVLVKPRLVF